MRSLRAAVGAALLVGGCGHPAGPGSTGPWLSSELLFQDAAVRAEKVAYAADRGRAYGMLCRPLAAGRHPVAVINHGGWSGLNTEWQAASSACVATARAGFVVVQASYRGEDGSDGEIELCLGEADDVARMVAVVRAQPYADPHRAVMFGGSHGGCVTVRALQGGLRVDRAVALNAPADLADVHANAVDRIAAGARGDRLLFFQSILALMQRLYGGLPHERPAEYARHSTLPEASRLAASPVPLMLQHGAADDVVPVGHSCRLAAAAGGFEAYRLGADGAVLPTAPAGCEGVPLAWRGGPLPSPAWPGARYLLVYEGMGHAGGPAEPRRSAHMGEFLRLGPAE